MDKRIDKLLKRASNHFNEWDEIFKKYILLEFGNDEIDDEDSLEILDNTSKVFSHLLMIFTEYGRFQDKFSIVDFFPNVSGIDSKANSEKLSCQFKLGTYLDEFYLESSILYPEHLKRMDDNFWRKFIELNQYGNFEFVENAWVQGAEKSDIERIFKNSKSNLVRLLKNYILLNIYDGDLIDIGWLSIKWSIKTYWDELIIKGCEAFKNLYNINYSLWRMQYLHSKK